MSEDSHLRLASDGETSSIESVEQSSRSGSRLGILRSMRLRLAQAFDNPETTATALAAITIRIADLTSEIDGLIAREKEESGESGSNGGASNGATDREFRPSAI